MSDKNGEGLGTPMALDGQEVDVGGGQCPTINLVVWNKAERVSFLSVKLSNVNLVNVWGLCSC